MMRVTTLKAGVDGPGAMIDYYTSLARDQHPEHPGRGPVDYYLDRNEPPGRWSGSGCKHLGLEGDVLPEQLEALLEARHPGSGSRLGRCFGGKSARGFDATFSAPKSLSVLWALSDDPWVRAEVLAAHDAAVVAALQWFEDHGSVTRRGTDGADQVDTKGIVTALFRQHTSRAIDPQIHTHAVISSKVQDHAGNWLSLDARFLKRQQRSTSYLYASALRVEVTRRLGLSWAPVVNGHAEAEIVPPALLESFSKRTAQVEEELARRIAAWVDKHDGAEPDMRTIARLQRLAVLASRPGKGPVIEAQILRAEWLTQARAVGFEALSLPAQPRLALGSVDDEAVIAEALDRVSASSATWLAADVAREIAALVPADAAGSATELVGLLDNLAARAVTRCIELHPPARENLPRRGDGRPISEHVTSRRLSTRAILGQEARLIGWARDAAGGGPARSGEDAAIRAVSGDQALVLMVGPAGAGKTTTLARSVGQLRQQDRAVIGLAPSGKAG
jgi:conjugative relaxase-like TrwC/TraI family protein